MNCHSVTFLPPPGYGSALYNDAGGLKEWVAGNTLKTQILPDLNMLRRPQEIKVLNAGGGTLWTTGTYSYDGAGNIKSIGVGSDIFTYDSVGRLKESQVVGTSSGTWYNDIYTYDPFNNILSKAETVHDTGSTTTTTKPTTTTTTTPYPANPYP